MYIRKKDDSWTRSPLLSFHSLFPPSRLSNTRSFLLHPLIHGFVLSSHALHFFNFIFDIYLLIYCQYVCALTTGVSLYLSIYLSLSFSLSLSLCFALRRCYLWLDSSFTKPENIMSWKEVRCDLGALEPR